MSLLEKALQKYAKLETEVSDQELKEILENDWVKASNDAALLEIAKRSVIEAKQMERGVVPNAFTQTTDCKYCGPVYVPEGWPQPATNNCPWCLNRLKGLSIPKGQTNAI